MCNIVESCIGKKTTVGGVIPKKCVFGIGRSGGRSRFKPVDWGFEMVDPGSKPVERGPKW